MVRRLSSRVMRWCSLAAFSLTLASSSTSFAQSPPYLPIQGVLTDSGGAPVDGSVAMTVRLYRSDIGGTAIFSESATVLVDAGVFTMYLGDLTPLDLSALSTGGPLYLGISVEGQAELAPRIEFGSVPFAAYAEFAGAMNWSDIVGIPSAIADGDANTTYTAAEPLELTGTTFGLSVNGCAAGETWIWTGTTWQCQLPGYTVGNGLQVSGGTMSVNTSVIQTRVASSCGLNQAIRQINPDGTVECEDDTVGGGVQTVTAGTGLTGGGSSSSVTLSIDPTVVQARVSGTCGTDLFMRGIQQDGTPVCATTPAAPAYNAGLGLSFDSGLRTFNVDDSVVQRRVATTCPTGEYMYGITQAGAPVCRPDVDTNTPPTVYTAGNGISITGTTIAINTAQAQARVAGGPCPYGIASIGADGSVSCASNNDTNTTYTGGLGITLSGTSFNADTTVLQRRVGGTCPYGIATVNADGTVVCAGNNDTNTTYAPGFGLSLSGSTFSVDPNTMQRRVVGACTWGIASIDANGNIACAGEADTNTWPPGYNSDCPNNSHYMYGRDDNGYALCRNVGDAINNNCMLWFGWSDSERACCETLGHSTVYGGYQGGYNGNGGEVRRHWWDPGGWGYTLLLQGVNTGGDVNGDDTFYIALRCY